MYFVHELLEIVDLAKKEQRYCDKCKEKPATHRCVDCKENFCEGCKTNHDGFSFLKHHTWERLSDDATPIIDKHIYCTKHKGEMAKLHCIDCDQLICILCKGTEHNFHQGETIDDAIERLMPGVKNQQEKVQAMIEQNEGKLSKLRADKAKVKAGYADIDKQIDDMVEEAIRKVREDGKKVKDSLAQTSAKHLHDIDQCEKELELQLNSQRNILDLADTTLASVHGASLLKALQSGVKESLEAQAKQKPHVPQYNSDVTVRFQVT